MYYDSTFKFQIYSYGELNIDIDIEKKIFLASTIEKIPIKIPTFLRNKP